MSFPVKALAATAVLLAAASVEAQVFPAWKTHITLTQQDLDMIHSAVTNQVHGKPVGTTASWSNPASGNSGSITLVKKGSRAKANKEVEYTARSKGPPVYTEHYHFTSCLQPDGTWKIAGA